MGRNQTPPDRRYLKMTKIERWIMRLCISREMSEFVLGDLEEIAAAAGSDFKRTRIRLWLHFLRALPLLMSENIQRRWGRFVIRRDDRGRQADRRVPNILPAACLSLGLACCLTILAITRDFCSEHDALDAHPVRNAFLASAPGESAFAAMTKVSLVEEKRTTSEIQTISLVRARRLLGWEFAIMFASGLVLINRLEKRAGQLRRRAKIWRTTSRSIGFSVAVTASPLFKRESSPPILDSSPKNECFFIG